MDVFSGYGLHECLHKYSEENRASKSREPTRSTLLTKMKIFIEHGAPNTLLHYLFSVGAFVDFCTSEAGINIFLFASKVLPTFRCFMRE